jgi:murein DD-endopeptidase MepM/ murein hydrolase activator NlpD
MKRFPLALFSLAIALVLATSADSPPLMDSQPSSIPSPLEETTPTPQLVEIAATVAVEVNETAAADAGQEPLRFTFPTPGPAPQSAWRPALYEAPWALGPHDHFYFARPIGADEVNWPLADYRYGGIFFSSDIVHTGVDIPAPRGTPVLAAAAGRVVWAGYGLYYGNNDPDDPYGLAVTIRHDFGYEGKRLYTVYAHMQQILVINGQLVQAGEAIGLVGTTGLTTGPHLHFEVRTDRNSYFATLNPELWLVPPVGWGVLVGQLRNTNGSILTEQDVVVRNITTEQKWTVRTYGKSTVNSDPYYQENLVLSDLPAGDYDILIDYLGERYIDRVAIHPGAITYFTFRGEKQFTNDLPAEPDIADLLPIFNPQTATNP